MQSEQRLFAKTQLKVLLPKFSLVIKSNENTVVYAEFLNEFQPTVIKGNAGEIGALVGSVEVSGILQFSS